MVDKKIHPKMHAPLLDYDGYLNKPPQVLIFEAARAVDSIAKQKWDISVESVNHMQLGRKQIALIINQWDEENQWAPLHYAVHHHNTYVFDRLTSREERFQCNVNLNGGRGENVLHIAARSPNIWRQKSDHPNAINRFATQLHRSDSAINEMELPQIVLKMLTLGADVNDKDDESRTPLHLAVQCNRYHYVRALVGHGADLKARTKLGANVLHFAFFRGPQKDLEELTDIVKFIIQSKLDKGKDRIFLAQQTTIEGATPLAFALCHPQVTQELATLVSEVRSEQLAAIMDLVARRCTGDLLNRNRELLAFFKWFMDRFIQHSNTKSQLFHIICRYDNLSLLELFSKCVEERQPVNHGSIPMIDQPDHMGYTPLLTAAFYNAKECAKWLLKSQIYDVNVLARTNNGENILHICAKRITDKELLECIWRNRIDAYMISLLQQMDVENNTPLFVAIRAKNQAAFNVIFDYLKNSKSQSDEHFINTFSNTTVYHEIGKIGNVDMLKSAYAYDEVAGRQTLLRQDLTDYTCIHSAVAKNHLEMVQYLINKLQVEVDTIGDRRRTPLHTACEKGYVEMVAFLLQKGASTTIRDANCYNCLEIAIVQQHEETVKKLLEQDSWRQMMRNAQPIDNTKGFDTPMRKLIRYLPDVAVWLIDKRLTTTIGGPGQKLFKTIYDYEFYEDVASVKNWYTKSDVVEESLTGRDLHNERDVACFFGYLCCCSCFRCCQRKSLIPKYYTDHASTLVHNHPLFISKNQTTCHALTQHPYNVFLRRAKLNSFGLFLFILSFFTYITYLVLLTTVVLRGKPPHNFYDRANVSMSDDLATCEKVSRYFHDNFNRTDEVFASDAYARIKVALYVIMSSFIAKNVIVIITLSPRAFFILASYLETSAVVLSYTHVLNWYSWQNDLILRCPVQYQLGAAGLLLSYINLLTYIRTAPVFDLGVYILMLHVITMKFFRFLPVLLIMICGFAFTYWMLLQNQTVYGTPIEAILRTSLMLFDLGYEDRLYKPDEDGVGYYKLVYVIFVLTAILFSIFVINLLIGLAVGEIPSLMTQGAIWRTHVLYNLTLDYEIMRIQFYRFLIRLSCCSCCRTGIGRFLLPLYITLQHDEAAGGSGGPSNGIHGCRQIFTGHLQETIGSKTTSTAESIA